MNTPKEPTYLEIYGDTPELRQTIIPELIQEFRIRADIDKLPMNPIVRYNLLVRVMDHLRSIHIHTTREQRLGYDWWIAIHLTDDDIDFRINRYELEYSELLNEAILCLQELERFDKSNYGTNYERYTLILERMHKIQYIKNGIKNNQSEPPDFV